MSRRQKFLVKKLQVYSVENTGFYVRNDRFIVWKIQVFMLETTGL
jgi:hypothetical protein